MSNWKKITLLLAFILFISCGSGDNGFDTFDGKALSEWQMIGIGSVEVTSNGDLKFTEGSESKGVVLVSPKAYGEKMELTFDVKPLRYEGVCVVFISMAMKDSSVDIQTPDNDGAFSRFTEGDIENYTFAFHTGYHQPNIFIHRNPGSKNLGMVKDVAIDQKWYRVTISRNDASLKILVDGKTALEVKDPETPLGRGKIGLRLRGPGDGSYSCLYRNLVIRKM